MGVVDWTVPPHRNLKGRCRLADHFDARGKRRVYGRGVFIPRGRFDARFYMDVWQAKDCSLFVRFWSTYSEAEWRSYVVEGFSAKIEEPMSLEAEACISRYLRKEYEAWLISSIRPMAKKLTGSVHEQFWQLERSINEKRMHSSSGVKMLELARGRVIAAFAAHWRSILWSYKDIAKERADCFFAGSASAQERLARSFYDREHARQMASLSTTEIRETLGPWLEHALRYWLDEHNEIGDPAGDNFLDELPTAEYVSIVYLHSSFAGPMLIDRYPGERVPYDDLYERMLSGFSSGGVLRIYKSTGECYTPSEARSMRAGIRQDLLSEILSQEGEHHPWQFDMEAEGKWKTEGFEGEDFERVVMVEVNDYR